MTKSVQWAFNGLSSKLLPNQYPALCYVTIVVPGLHTWNPSRPAGAKKRLLTTLHRTTLRPSDPLETGSKFTKQLPYSLSCMVQDMDHRQQAQKRPWLQLLKSCLSFFFPSLLLCVVFCVLNDLCSPSWVTFSREELLNTGHSSTGTLSLCFLWALRVSVTVSMYIYVRVCVCTLSVYFSCTFFFLAYPFIVC